VADGAKANASPGQRARLIEELRQIGRQAQSLGLSHDQIHELLSVALGELDEQAAHDLAGNLS
jgi:hypothetical protein